MPRYAYMMLDQIEKDVSRQAMQLDTIGNFDKIFVERLTPRSDKLEQRQRLLDALAPGDVVFAAAADRFCRQTRDFLDVYARIEAVGVDEHHVDRPAGVSEVERGHGAASRRQVDQTGSRRLRQHRIHLQTSVDASQRRPSSRKPHSPSVRQGSRTPWISWQSAAGREK